MKPQEIIKFWFEECEQKQWFEKNTDFDQMVHDRFTAIHNAAGQGELLPWRQTPEGRLAEIIILDQFSRNMFRDKPGSFAYDGMALALSQEGIQQKDDNRLTQQQRMFFYMPFMHSESKIVHEWAIKHFERLGMDMTLDFAHSHKRIIDRFGRYPHRNTILGRETTAEEAEFLAGPDSSF